MCGVRNVNLVHHWEWVALGTGEVSDHCCSNLLRGMLLDLLEVILSSRRDTSWLEPASLKLLSARAAGMHGVAEISKKYRDGTKYVGDWTMSELLGWTDCYFKPIMY